MTKIVKINSMYAATVSLTYFAFIFSSGEKHILVAISGYFWVSFSLFSLYISNYLGMKKAGGGKLSNVEKKVLSGMFVGKFVFTFGAGLYFLVQAKNNEGVFIIGVISSFIVFTALNYLFFNPPNNNKEVD